MRKFICLFFCYLLLSDLSAQNNYSDEITQWKAERLRELKSENGWLNLAGLFWLEEGRTLFGSGKNVLLRFPIQQLPVVVGYFERKGNIVKQVYQNNINIEVNGVVTKDEVVFDPAFTQQPVVNFGTYRWSLIQRDDKIGIRLRNLKHPAINQLKEIPCFPLDTNWRIEAKLIRPFIQYQIPVQNVLGQTILMSSPGKLRFTINNQEYMLDALTEGDKLFIVFGDATSGKTTYPAGRFLYAHMPGDDGVTVLDFNQSFNPPCAFTPYATCPLPPSQNILPIAITAGEMKAGNH